MRPNAAAAAVGGLLVLAVAGAVAQLSLPSAAAQARQASHGRRPGGSATPVGAVLVCPDVRVIRGTEGTIVGVASSTHGGSVATRPATRATLSASPALTGRASSVLLRPPSGPLVIQATGPIAGGLVAEQVSRANSSPLRGWADVACTAPRATQWFVGPGTVVGETPTVTISNPDSSPALVDVNVLTPSGPTASQAGQGLAIAPHTVQVISLARLAPGAPATAVEVAAVSGRVAASVRDVRVSGSTDLGTDYAPPTSGPQHVVTVAGVVGQVLGQTPSRELILANPASTDTSVQVSVSSAAGSYVPTQLAAIPVPADSVRTVALSAALRSVSSASMLTVTATGGPARVLAGVLITASSTITPIQEIAYLGATPALRGPGIVPVNPTSSKVTSTLELAAPRSTARVEISVHTATGLNSRVVTVPAGETLSVALADQHATEAAVTLTPLAGSGPLYAARLIVEHGARGPLLAAYPVTGSATQVAVPAVAAAALGQP